MADFGVESHDYYTSRDVFTWKGDDADEAVAQFITAMDSAADADARVLPFHREAFVQKTMAELLAGESVCIRLVGSHRITLTRTATN